jgi:3-hydroxy acid dehydrogenase/malonic semialdehyde reductase
MMKEFLTNKIVFITGASSGIGKACAEQFASQGAHLILTARRFDRIEKLAEKLQKQYGVKVLPIALDIQERETVEKVVHELTEEWKFIDILINNAGLALTTDAIQAANPTNWDIMIRTNICGLLYTTHAILPQMIARNGGHIINIGSTAAHECYTNGNVYCATKHAVKAFSKSLRIDLLGKAIRVTEIDPGCVETEFSEVRWKDKKRAKEFYSGFTPLVAEDIADAAIYCTTRPLHVNIAEMIIYPTEQASANHLHRKS